MNGRRAAFLDRDGVINEDRGYVSRLEDFVLINGVIEALHLLARAGYLLVIVTNQSGIGRGYYDEKQFDELTRDMIRILAEEGIELARVAHCPHLPTHLQKGDPCTCRKPLPGMLTDSAAALGIDLSKSIMIGDNDTDMAAGRAAGVMRCILIGDGQPADADAFFPDLLTCARYVISDPSYVDSARR